MYSSICEHCNARDFANPITFPQAWSPDIYFTWACGRQIKECHTIKLCKEASEDISIRMKRRALKGYGLKVIYHKLMIYILCHHLNGYSNIHCFTREVFFFKFEMFYIQETLDQNATIVWDDPQLRDLWFWIQDILLTQNFRYAQNNVICDLDLYILFILYVYYYLVVILKLVQYSP